MEEAIRVYNSTYHDIIRAIPSQLWSGTVEERREALRNTEVRRIQGNPVKISRCSFEPGMRVLVYDHVRASARSQKMDALWKGPVKLLERKTSHIWTYEERQLSGGRGRRRICEVHEDHLQTYDDKQ